LQLIEKKVKLFEFCEISFSLIDQGSVMSEKGQLPLFGGINL
jgi:hypothetical protein